VSDSQHAWNQGKNDAQKGLGPKSPQDHKTWQEREKYDAGYQQKQREQQGARK